MAPPYGIQDVLLPVHVKMELSPPPSAYGEDYHHHHHHPPERPEAGLSSPEMLRTRDDDSTSLCGSTSDSSQFLSFDPEYLPQPIYEDISDPEDGEPPHHRGPRFARENGIVLQFAPNVVARPAAGSLGGALRERLGQDESTLPACRDIGHHAEEVTLVKSELDLDYTISDPIEVELKRMFNSPTPPPCSSPLPALARSSPSPPSSASSTRCSSPSRVSPPPPPTVEDESSSVPPDSGGSSNLCHFLSSSPPPCSSTTPPSPLCFSATTSPPCSSTTPPPPCSSTTPPPPCSSTTPPPPCSSTTPPPPPLYSSTTTPPPCFFTTLSPLPCSSTTLSPPPCSSTTPPPLPCSSTTPPPLPCSSTTPPLCPSASPPTLPTPKTTVPYESPMPIYQSLAPSSSSPIQSPSTSPCAPYLLSLSPAISTSVTSSVLHSSLLHSIASQRCPTPSSASSPSLPSPPLPPMLSPRTPPSLPSPSPPYSPPTPPPPSQCSLSLQTCPSNPVLSRENFLLNKEDIPTGDSGTCKPLSVEKRRKSAPELSIPLPVIQLRRKERASSWTYADSDFSAIDKCQGESKEGNYFQRLKLTRANSVWKVVGCENCNCDTSCKSPSKLSEPSETLADLGQCSKTMHKFGDLREADTGVCQDHNKCDFETQSKAVLSVGVKDTLSDKDIANVDLSYDEETQLNVSGDSCHDNSVKDGCVVKDSINILTKSISDIMCNTNETSEVISKKDTFFRIKKKTNNLQHPNRPDEDDVNLRETSSYAQSSKIQSKDGECEDISETVIKMGEENVTGGVADIQANSDMKKKELEKGNHDFIKEDNCNNEYEDDEDNEGELKIDEDRLSGDENEQISPMLRNAELKIQKVEILAKTKAENSLKLLNCEFQLIRKKLEPEKEKTIDVIELSDDEPESKQSPNMKEGSDSKTNSISRVHVIQSPKCMASLVKKSTESSEDKKMISGSECTQDKQIMNDKELSIVSDSETVDSTTSVLEGDSAKPHEENYTMLNEKTDSIQEIVDSEEIESRKVLESGNEQSVVIEPPTVKRKLVKDDDVGIPLKSRKLRPSRRNFRHDNIKMFKVSSVKPSPPPWMYRRKSLSAEKQERSLSGTTQSSGASEDKHIVSVNESSVEKESSGNQGSNETRNEVSKKKRRPSLEHDEHLILKKVRRSASDASDESQQPHGNETSIEDKDESEVKDEGLKDTKRKKRKSLGDQSVLEEVSKQFVSHQMQEKGRRLAQEIPGFNWLEEKIRSGGVPMKPPVKRSSTETQSSSLTKEVINDEDGSKANGPSESSVPVTGTSDENSSSRGSSHSIVMNTGNIAPLQQNRAPVIVSTRQLGNISERMDPLLKQLASGGDLEITISRQANQASEMSSPKNESDAIEPSAIVIPATTVSTSGITETVPVTITFPTTLQGSQAIVTSSTSVPTISQTSPFIVSALQGSVPNVLNSVDSTQRLHVLSAPQERVTQTHGTENRLNVSLNNGVLEQRPAVDLPTNIQMLPPNAAPLSNASRQTRAATESGEQAALSSPPYNFLPYSSTHMSANNYNFSQPSHTSQSSLQHTPHYFQQTALNVGLRSSHPSHLPHTQTSCNAQGPLMNEVPQPQTNQIFREQLLSQPPQLMHLPQPHNATNSARLGNLRQQSPSIQLANQVVENNARVQIPSLSHPVVSSQQSRYSSFYPSVSNFSRIPESANHSQSLHFHRPQMPHLPSSSAQVVHSHVPDSVGLSASTQLPPLLPLSQTAYPALPPLQRQFSQAAPNHQAVPASHLQNEARHNDYLASLRMQQNLLMRRNQHLNHSHQYNSVHGNDLQNHPQSNVTPVYPTNSLPRSTSHLPTERDFPSLPEYLRINNHPGGQLEQRTLAAQSQVTSQSSFIPPHQPPLMPHQPPLLLHQPPHQSSHSSHQPIHSSPHQSRYASLQFPHLPHQSPHLPHQSPHLPHQSPHLPYQSPHLPPQSPYQSPHLPQQSPHPPQRSPHPPLRSPHPPQQSPHLPQQSPRPPQQSPHPPQQSPHPPQQSPHPPQQSPHPPQQSPHPPQQSPHLPQQSPHPPQQSPRPPQQSPRPPQQSPHPPQQSPHPPQQSPHPPQQSPHPPQQSPHPPRQSPHPPRQSPHPPWQSPHPPQQSPHLPQQFPHLPQQSPHLPQQSPHLPQQSPHPLHQSSQPPQQSPQRPHISHPPQQPPQQSPQLRHPSPQLQQSYLHSFSRVPPYPHLPPRPYLPPPQSQSYHSPPATEQQHPPPLLLIQPQLNVQQMLGRQMLSSGQEETRAQTAPKSPNSDYSDCLATMARHAAAAVDTGLGTGFHSPVYQNERIRPQVTAAAAYLPTSSQRFSDVTYASRPQLGRPTAHPEEQEGQNASAHEPPAVSSSQAHIPVSESNENNKRHAVGEQTSRTGGIDENASDEDIESLERLRHITNKEIEEMPKCLNEVQLAFNETARNLEKEGLLPAGTKNIVHRSVPHRRVTCHPTPVNCATLSASQPSRSCRVSADASSPSHSSHYFVEQQTPIFQPSEESRTGLPCMNSQSSERVPDTVEVPVTLKLKHSVASNERTENRTSLAAEAAVTGNVTAASAASITAEISTSAVDVTSPETFITVTAAAPVIAVGTASSRLATATALVPGGTSTTTITASSENIKESRMPISKYAVLSHEGPTSSSLENRNEQNASLIVLNTELPNRDIAQIQNSVRGAIQVPHSSECTVDGSVAGDGSAGPVSIPSDSSNERSTLMSVDDQNTRRRLSSDGRHSDTNESPLDLSVGSQRPKDIIEPVNRTQQVSDTTSSFGSLEEHRSLPTVPTSQHVCAANIENDFSQLRNHLLSRNIPLAAAPSSESFPEVEIVEETYPPDPKHQDSNSISNRILGEDTLSTVNVSTELAVPLGAHAVCYVCQRPALFVCSLCNRTKYCSKQCQGYHWMKHKNNCIRM